MPGVISAEKLAAQVCNSLGLPPRDHAEGLAETLRTALANTRAAAVAATKAVCLEIAEDEAERCRSVGATTAQQTALTVAARIRRRQI
jgi:hypothetical protein